MINSIMNLFIFFHFIRCENNDVPVISVFCYYPDSSYQSYCQNLYDQLSDTRSLINRYQHLINEYNSSEPNETIETYKIMINYFKKMDYHQISNTPTKIADIRKKTEILYVLQYGSMENNRHSYDFSVLTGSMIIDISMHTQSVLIEDFITAAAITGLKRDSLSVTNLRSFLNYREANHKRIDQKICNYSHYDPSLMRMRIKEFNDDYNAFKNNIPKKQIKDNSPLVRISGNGGKNVPFLLLSDCQIMIIQSDLNIPSLSLAGNIQLAPESYAINTDYCIVTLSLLLSYNIIDTGDIGIDSFVKIKKISFLAETNFFSLKSVLFKSQSVTLIFSHLNLELPDTMISMQYNPNINQLSIISQVQEIVPIELNYPEGDPQNETDFISFPEFNFSFQARSSLHPYTLNSESPLDNQIGLNFLGNWDLISQPPKFIVESEVEVPIYNKPSNVQIITQTPYTYHPYDKTKLNAGVIAVAVIASVLVIAGVTILFLYQFLFRKPPEKELLLS